MSNPTVQSVRGAKMKDDRGGAGAQRSLTDGLLDELEKHFRETGFSSAVSLAAELRTLRTWKKEALSLLAEGRDVAGTEHHCCAADRSLRDRIAAFLGEGGNAEDEPTPDVDVPQRPLSDEECAAVKRILGYGV